MILSIGVVFVADAAAKLRPPHRLPGHHARGMCGGPLCRRCDMHSRAGL
jgi:hypothetical protein